MCRSSSIVILFFLILCNPLKAQESDSTEADTASQDRILLMNGKELKGRILEKGIGEVNYKHKVRGDWKEEAFAKGRIFSLKPAGAPEEVLYEQDSSIGNLLERGEMRYFIHGEQDARSGYTAPWTTVGGVVIGGVGAYFLEFTIFTLAVPLVYTLGSTIPKVRVDEGTVSDPAYLDREFYLKGYERQARNHRLLNALKGSVGGILLGMGIYAIVHPDQLR